MAKLKEIDNLTKVTKQQALEIQALKQDSKQKQTNQQALENEIKQLKEITSLQVWKIIMTSQCFGCDCVMWFGVDLRLHI